MSYNLFLDDIRMPIDAFAYTNFKPYIENEWIIVRNYDEFVNYINQNGLPNIIGFDHDISDEHYCPPEYYEKYNDWLELVGSTEKTGMDCAKWLVDYCIDNNLKLPNYYVHSMNPAGKENIESYLSNFLKHQQNNK